MFSTKTPWIILLVVWMIGSTWWHVCKIKQLCADESPAAATLSAVETTPPGADAFTIHDGDLFHLELPGHFSFAKSGANPSLASLGGSLEPLVSYLKEHPDRKLLLTGYYTSAETNTTTYQNLGIGRAEGLKEYLVKQGLPAGSIQTAGEERNLPFNAAGDSVYGGIFVGFDGALPAETVKTETPAPEEPTEAPKPTELVKIDKPITEKELAKAEKFTSLFKPIDLYFQLAEANYIKTDETEKFFTEAVKYLADHKDKKLILTGHTDNTGTEQVNMTLSRDRANDVKVKLMKLGIKSDQITVKAKGESEPKADNSTISGRKANRRVTVVVE